MLESKLVGIVFEVDLPIEEVTVLYLMINSVDCAIRTKVQLSRLIHFNSPSSFVLASSTFLCLRNQLTFVDGINMSYVAAQSGWEGCKLKHAVSAGNFLCHEDWLLKSNCFWTRSRISG